MLGRETYKTLRDGVNPDSSTSPVLIDDGCCSDCCSVFTRAELQAIVDWGIAHPQGDFLGCRVGADFHALTNYQTDYLYQGIIALWSGGVAFYGCGGTGCPTELPGYEPRPPQSGDWEACTALIEAVCSDNGLDTDYQ